MPIRKCDHGVYWPEGDAKAMSCQQCNPDGTGTGSAPVMPRSAADLVSHKIGSLEMCPQCLNVRTYFSPNCRGCGFTFPPADPRQQGLANAHQPGTCPKCGSNVHYETSKARVWQCADCDAKYTAPRRKAE